MADTPQTPSNKPKPVIVDNGPNAHMLSSNDDRSAGPVELGFPVNFFGTVFTSLYVNTNGNVTFREPLYKYLPFRMTTQAPPIIAPFLADVDTRPGASGRVRYGPTTFEGRYALGVNWLDVGYHWERLDKLNRFQLLLVDRSDLGFGDFDIVMNYDRMAWESGESAGGSEGLGGLAAGAGFSAGTGETDTFFEFPGALANGGLLDSNLKTGLTNTKRNSDILGRHIFRMRRGRIDFERSIREGGHLMPRAVLLADGRVLALGEFNPFSDVFNPVTDEWAATGKTTANRRRHTATLLPDGRVLVTGGEDKPRTAELYDPVAGTWAAVTDMSVGRIDHTATLLPDGRVLVVGGHEAFGSTTRNATAELFDPQNGNWTSTGSMQTARSAHTATLVSKNGRALVLVAGGEGATSKLASAELYDPETGTWTATGNMGLVRYAHTATRLQDGRVLVAGGEPSDLSDEFPEPRGRAELYDPATGSWAATGRMNRPRRSHAAVPLNTGHVLVLGGFHESAGIQAGVELYDPVLGSWSVLGPMQVRREFHAALLLEDGRILIVGGITNPNTLQGTYELYYHPFANR
ncbi:Kelch repeat-containing protein [Archangium lansingense]|uniref:NIDO domain-containing protein n=1 Tax=Archangium lansingense TaxID=2995310 RepID=A0ABT4AF36_9BACT|nr:kelch repeat-containing protein [Archangium lansinium]MCY1079507.1 hypothetical protein [Archangium lansinium]